MAKAKSKKAGNTSKPPGKKAQSNPVGRQVEAYNKRTAQLKSYVKNPVKKKK